MPLPYDPNEDDDKDKGSNTQVSSGGSVLDNGQQQAQSQEKGSGRFQNLQSYLSANQGSGFGEKFAGKLNEDIGGANSKIQGAGDTFKQASDVGSVKYNEGLINQGLGQSTAADFVKDQNNVNEFQKERDASYKGPKDLSETNDLYQQAYGAANKAQSTANAAQKEGGRFALLGNYFGRPGYSQGEKNLDQLIVSGDDKAKQGISQARENAAQVQQNFQKTQGDVHNYADQNAKMTADTRNKVRSGIGIDDAGNYLAQDKGTGAVQKGLNDLDTQTSGAISTKHAAAGKMGEDFAHQKLSADQYQKLGLDPNMHTYNMPMDKYISETGDPNRSQMASPEQRAHFQALEKLAGGGNIGSLDYNASQYDPSNPYSFDKDKFMGDAGVAKAQYNDALKSTRVPTNYIAPGYDPNGKAGGKSISGIVNDPNMSTDQKIAAINELSNIYPSDNDLSLSDAMASAREAGEMGSYGDAKTAGISRANIENYNTLAKYQDLIDQKYGAYNTLGGGMDYSSRVNPLGVPGPYKGPAPTAVNPTITKEPPKNNSTPTRDEHGYVRPSSAGDIQTAIDQSKKSKGSAISVPGYAGTIQDGYQIIPTADGRMRVVNLTTSPPVKA